MILKMMQDAIKVQKVAINLQQRNAMMMMMMMMCPRTAAAAAAGEFFYCTVVFLFQNENFNTHWPGTFI